MWFDLVGWGVTPAAAGVRVARGRGGRKWPTIPTYRKLLAPRVAWQDGRASSFDSDSAFLFSVSPSLTPFLRCELRGLRHLPLASAPASRQSTHYPFRPRVAGPEGPALRVAAG